MTQQPLVSSLKHPCGVCHREHDTGAQALECRHEVHRLTTHGEFDANGDRIYIAHCSCGWAGPETSTGPQAAKSWMQHREEAG